MKKWIWVTLIHPFYTFGIWAKELPMLFRYPILLNISIYNNIYYFFFYPFLRHMYEKHRSGFPVSELVYGDTPRHSFEEVLAHIPVQTHDQFVDLGCGKGDLVFYMAVSRNIPSLGVDVIPTFIRQANKAKKIHRILRAEFRKMSFFDCKLTDATIIYIAGTCLAQDTRKKLAQFITRTAPKGAHVISTTYPMIHSHLTTIHTLKVKFSWGIGTVYIQKIT